MIYQIAPVSYGAAAAAFGVLLVLLVSVWRHRVRGSVLTVVCLVTVVWACVLAYSSVQANTSATRVLLAEFALDSAWLIFLSSLLGGAVAAKSSWVVRRGGVYLGLALLAGVVILETSSLKLHHPSAMGYVLIMGSIMTSLFGLIGIEQIYRNARPVQKNGLKFLCLGLAGMFSYDIFLYSNAVIDGHIRPSLWAARGFLVASCALLIGVSVSRLSSWQGGFFASRQVVFYTATLFAAGVYLSLVGIAGYLIKSLDREIGDALQLIFFSVAVIGLFVLMLSDQLRGKARVFITKHPATTLVTVGAAR